MCSPCGLNQNQSSDGWNCINRIVSCNSSGFVTDRDLNGAFYLNNGIPTLTCILCDPSTVATSSGCTSCYPFVFTETPESIANIPNFCSLNCAKLSAGICIYNITSKDLIIDDYSLQVGNNEKEKSWFIETYAAVAYDQCRIATSRNVTACQLLLNMCILNYNSGSGTSIQKNPCDAFAFIKLRPLSADIPTLESEISIASYETISVSQVELKLVYDDTKSTCRSNALSFVAAKYKLNGNLISYSAIDLSELEICNFFTTDKVRLSENSFIAINYKKTCKLNVNKLIYISPNEPIFYELYLRYRLDNGTFSLLPVPIVVNNRNRFLSQRFFLIDKYSVKTSQSEDAQYVRYASSINIEFKLFNDNSDIGRIYPPILYINYNSLPITATNSPEVTFSVNYIMNIDAQLKNAWISVAVLASLAFLWSIIRSWSWNKRNGKMSSDIITVFKFFMYICNSCGNVFFVVFIGLCIWWLIVFKGQSFAYILTPQGNQESMFNLLLIVAFVLKALDVLHLIFVQVSYDIFAIDWEKPKVETGKL